MLRQLVFLLPLLLASCISVQLPFSQTESAKDVKFEAPSAPFKSMKSNLADQTWISADSGNTISFRTECGNPSDTLESLIAEPLSAISDKKTVSTNKDSFNNRDAMEVVTWGKVDGVPVQIRLLALIKNGCSYLITYGGVDKNFAQEQKHFEDFKKSFVAP